MKDTNDRVTMELPVVGKRRPGRQKSSLHTPKKQNAIAQQNRRESMKQAGYSWRGFWLNNEAQAALSGLKSILGCTSQDEAIGRLLLAANDPAILAVLGQRRDTQKH